MASSYPTALDTFTNPAGTDPVTSPDHAQQHSDVNDAVEAIQAKLGISASTPTSGKVLRATGTGSSAWGAVVLTTDVTGALPVANGGTGSATAADARTALGLAIGTNVQAYDATLQSISALGTAADKMLYTTGIDTWAEAALTAFGRSLIDDADASAARTTLGLAIGTDVQAYDADLAAIAALSPTKGNLIVGNGSAWVALGVGSNDQILTADSAQSAGVKWATASSGGFSSRFAVYKAADQTITAGAIAKINFDTERFDGASEYDNATNYRFTAGATGYYFISAFLRAAHDTSYSSALYIKKNGSDYAVRWNSQGGGSEPKGFHFAEVMYLAATDYVEVFFYNNSLASKDVYGGATGSAFTGHRLS